MKHLCLGSHGCPNRSDRPSPSSATFHQCHFGYTPMGPHFPTGKWGSGQPDGLELLKASMQWPLQSAARVASTEGVLRRSKFGLFAPKLGVPTQGTHRLSPRYILRGDASSAGWSRPISCGPAFPSGACLCFSDGHSTPATPNRESFRGSSCLHCCCFLMCPLGRHLYIFRTHPECYPLWLGEQEKHGGVCRSPCHHV